nr:MAG: capsid protein [Cressdnaviricota sp.]
MKRTYKRRSKKRSFRKKRRSNRRTDIVFYRGIGFPTEYFCKLKYSSLDQLNTTSFNKQFQSSLFDPDLTGLGHQPMYYDQLCSANGPYQRYEVLNMNVTIEFINTNLTNYANAGYYWSDSSTLATNMQAVYEQKFSSVRMLDVASGHSNHTFKTSMSAKKMHGQGLVNAVDSFFGVYNNNPVDQYFLTLYVSDSTDGITQTVTARTRITYSVRFFDLTTQAGS